MHSTRVIVIVVAVWCSLPWEGDSQGAPTCSGMIQSSNGQWIAQWKVLPDGTVTFNVSAITLGWVGIGFSHDQEMPHTDTVIGAASADNTQFFVYDGYATEHSLPPPDVVQDITSAKAEYVFGFTVVSFSRPIVTGDSEYDVNLDECVYVLWAFNGVVASYDPPDIDYHYSDRGVATSTLCLPVTECQGNTTSSFMPFPSTSLITSTTISAPSGSSLILPTLMSYSSSSNTNKSPSVANSLYFTTSPGVPTSMELVSSKLVPSNSTAMTTNGSLSSSTSGMIFSSHILPSFPSSFTSFTNHFLTSATTTTNQVQPMSTYSPSLNSPFVPQPSTQPLHSLFASSMTYSPITSESVARNSSFHPTSSLGYTTSRRENSQTSTLINSSSLNVLSHTSMQLMSMGQSVLTSTFGTNMVSSATISSYLSQTSVHSMLASTPAIPTNSTGAVITPSNIPLSSSMAGSNFSSMSISSFATPSSLYPSNSSSVYLKPSSMAYTSSSLVPVTSTTLPTPMTNESGTTAQNILTTSPIQGSVMDTASSVDVSSTLVAFSTADILSTPSALSFTKSYFFSTSVTTSTNLSVVPTLSSSYPSSSFNISTVTSYHVKPSLMNTTVYAPVTSESRIFTLLPSSMILNRSSSQDVSQTIRSNDMTNSPLMTSSAGQRNVTSLLTSVFPTSAMNMSTSTGVSITSLFAMSSPVSMSQPGSTNQSSPMQPTTPLSQSVPASVTTLHTTASIVINASSSVPQGSESLSFTFFPSTAAFSVSPSSVASSSMGPNNLTTNLALTSLATSPIIFSSLSLSTYGGGAGGNSTLSYLTPSPTNNSLVSTPTASASLSHHSIQPTPFNSSAFVPIPTTISSTFSQPLSPSHSNTSTTSFVFNTSAFMSVPLASSLTTSSQYTENSSTMFMPSQTTLHSMYPSESTVRNVTSQMSHTQSISNTVSRFSASPTPAATSARSSLQSNASQSPQSSSPMLTSVEQSYTDTKTVMSSGSPSMSIAPSTGTVFKSSSPLVATTQLSTTSSLSSSHILSTYTPSMSPSPTLETSSSIVKSIPESTSTTSLEQRSTTIISSVAPITTYGSMVAMTTSRKVSPSVMVTKDAGASMTSILFPVYPTYTPPLSFENSLIIVLAGYSTSTFTLEVEVSFRTTVAKVINNYCSANTDKCKDILAGSRKRQGVSFETDDVIVLGTSENNGVNLAVTSYVQMGSSVVAVDFYEKAIENGVSEGTFDQAGFTVLDVKRAQEQNGALLSITTIIGIAIAGVGFLILVVVVIIVGTMCFKTKRSSEYSFGRMFVTDKDPSSRQRYRQSSTGIKLSSPSADEDDSDIFGDSGKSLIDEKAFLERKHCVFGRQDTEF